MRLKCNEILNILEEKLKNNEMKYYLTYPSQHKTNAYPMQNKSIMRSSNKKEENSAIIDVCKKRKDEKFEIRIGNLEEPQFIKMFEDIQNDENQKKRFVMFIEKFRSQQSNDIIK